MMTRDELPPGTAPFTATDDNGKTIFCYARFQQSTTQARRAKAMDVAQTVLRPHYKAGVRDPAHALASRPACVLHGRCASHRAQAISKEQFKSINRASAEHFALPSLDSTPVDEAFEQAVRAFLGREILACREEERVFADVFANLGT